jgi:hypothetical protein
LTLEAVWLNEFALLIGAESERILLLVADVVGIALIEAASDGADAINGDRIATEACLSIGSLLRLASALTSLLAATPPLLTAGALARLTPGALRGSWSCLAQRGASGLRGLRGLAFVGPWGGSLPASPVFWPVPDVARVVVAVAVVVA